MTAATGKMFSVGARSVTVFALGTDGLPTLGTVGVLSVGTTMSAFKAFEITKPNARRINHVGNDRLLALDFLPPLEGVTATLRTGTDDFDVDAVLTGVTKATVGESVMLADSTDKQGFEPFVAVVAFQQAQSKITKARNWRSWIFPSTKAIPMATGMGDNPTETTYDLGPSPVSYHIWGTAIIEGTDGATEAAIIRAQSEGKPAYGFSIGNASGKVFSFPAASATIGPPSTALLPKIVVWTDGVKKSLTTDYTVTVAAVTFETAATPGSAARVAIYWEW